MVIACIFCVSLVPRLSGGEPGYEANFVSSLFL